MKGKLTNIIVIFFYLTTTYTGFSQIDSSYIEIEPVQKDADIPTILIDTNHYGLEKARKKGFELLKIIPEPCNSDNVYDKIKYSNNYNALYRGTEIALDGRHAGPAA